MNQDFINNYPEFGPYEPKDEPAVENSAPEIPLPPTHSGRQGKMRDNAFKTLAGVGLVVVLIGFGWLGARAVAYLPNAISALASAFVNVQSVFIPNERIVLTPSVSSIRSGDEFTLSWEHRGKDTNGGYTFDYECQTGVHIERTTSDGKTTTLFCNIPTSLLDTETTIRVSAYSTANEARDLIMNIAFTENGSNSVDREGSAQVVVTPAGSTVVGTDIVTPTPIGTGTNGGGTTPGTKTEETNLFFTGTSTTPKTSNPNGKPDLKVTILAVGSVDRSTNEFTATSSIRAIERAGVKFEVVNIGTKQSGSWLFSAVLPTSPAHIYQSKSQPNLYPGDRIEFTLGFDAIRDLGDNVVIVNADNIGSLQELSETNNIAQATIIALPNN